MFIKIAKFVKWLHVQTTWVVFDFTSEQPSPDQLPLALKMNQYHIQTQVIKPSALFINLFPFAPKSFLSNQKENLSHLEFPRQQSLSSQAHRKLLCL